MKPGNQLCTSAEKDYPISTLEECKVASSSLALTFDRETNLEDDPQGCYAHGAPGDTPTKSYWNKSPGKKTAMPIQFVK